MRFSFAILALLSSIVLAACGGAKAGDSCNTDGFLCEDATTALECRLGTWRALPCRGPKGCAVSGSKVSCDMSLNREADNCAASTEGQGLCDASGTFALQCRNGTLIRASDCTSCTVSGEQVICTK